MERIQVEQIIENKLNDISYLENRKILVGKQSYNNDPYGIFFIDYGDDKIPENLNAFQESTLAENYYNHPGYLQWNYYLVFLRNSYTKEEKNRIEADTVFSRKFLFKPDELFDYLDYKHTETELDSDVVGKWKDKLRLADLDEVYSDEQFTAAVKRFISSKVKKDKENYEIKENQIDHQKIDSIKSIILKENYRKYPNNQRSFNFGKVNLIKGVNGSGKTSLLEAIELVLAGKSNRDPKSQEKGNCIQAIYNNGEKDSYTPSKTIKYKQRGKQWYSSGSEWGNDLYLAFNKYNFFDSDAAYNVSLGSVGDDLLKYITSIALGVDYNRIIKRIETFSNLLKQENSIRLKEVKSEEKNISLANQQLENLKKSASADVSINNVKTLTTQINWRKDFLENSQESIQEFESNFISANSILSTLNELLSTFKVRNLSGISEELKKINSAIEEFRKSDEQLKIKKEEIDNAKSFQGDLVESYNLLKKAKKYYDDEQSFRIEDIDIKILGISKECQKLEKITEILRGLKNKDILNSTEKFETQKEKILNKLSTLKEEKEKVTISIDSLKDTLDNIDKIVIQIKGLGDKYLKLNNEANTCPLCETTYSFQELENRIGIVRNDISENQLLKEYNTKKNDLEISISEWNSKKKDIEIIESAILILDLPNYSNRKIVELLGDLDKSKTRLDSLKAEKQNLENLNGYLIENNYTHSEFNELKSLIETRFPEYQFSADFKNKFNQLFDNTEKEISTKEKEINDLEVKLEIIRNGLIKIIEPFFDKNEIKEWGKELTYRKESLIRVEQLFSDLKEYVQVESNDDISKISINFENLGKLIESFKTSQKIELERNFATKIIDESNEKTRKINKEISRIKSGLNTIESILNEHNEGAYLNEFLERNIEEIQEIFQNIHSPKEFSKVVFDNGIELEKVDGTKTKLNKISTGQRSALAISIFLALNKKLKNGPSVILFDDPVTYTDDLNILSFLDYLREIVIKDNRQIFFATANQRLAGLFEKKFAFLGDEAFKQFPLERI
jgi:DNA repair exonuclease SbcCD ATPase subunit